MASTRFAEVRQSAFFNAAPDAVRRQFADIVLIRVPLPPVVGGLVRPLLEKQVRREVQAAIEEDRYDLEVRGYPAPTRMHRCGGSARRRFEHAAPRRQALRTRAAASLVGSSPRRS